MKNILVVGAHPDDIELGCMGTIMRLKKEGKKIYGLILTKGENWEKKTYIDRMEEQNDSSSYFAFEKFYVGNFKDGYLRRDSEMIDFISQIIIENKIDTVFCQYYEDSHQDHVISAQVTKSACMHSDNLLYYESLTSQNFSPNLFVGITDYEIKKENALMLFSSQIKKYNGRNQNLVDYVNSKGKIYGIKIKCAYAEGFVVDKLKYN